MATAAKTLRSPGLYEQDFYLWLEEQKNAVTTRDTEAIDWDNLAEEIEGLAGSERREIRSRLKQLYQHLLKWQFQPERRCNSWQSTIGEQRTHIDGILEASPSLRRWLVDSQSWSYEHACRAAQIETGFKLKFPAQVPWSIESVMDPAFMPGRPWKPEDLIRD